jgi:carbon-monoxide dehydrogenase medium subunit
VSAFRYARPSTLEEAIGLLADADGEAHLMAGGTSLALLMKNGLVSDGLIVDLGAIPGLDDIRVTDGGALEIGALASLRRVERDQLVRERHPALAGAVSRVATVRIRNQGTMGGNLAHADPAQDPPAILVALDAEVEVTGPNGARTLPLGDLFVDVFETSLAPDEILTTVRVPASGPGSRARYEKFLPRTADDYATVSVAVRLTVDGDSIADARLVVGAAGPTPIRVTAAEDALRGRRTDDVDLQAVAAAARDAVDPVDDVRGSADYKREMAGVWAARAVRRLLADGADGADGAGTR